MVLNGGPIGNSSTTNGWNVTYSAAGNTLTITVPGGAGPALGYEARYHSGNVTVSVIFDVSAANTVLAGMGPFPVAITGADTPANSQSWDIRYNGNVIACSSGPAGWMVSLAPSGTALMVSAPSPAVSGPG